MQNSLLLEIDFNKRELEEVIAEWMQNNESTWKPWVAAGS